MAYPEPIPSHGPLSFAKMMHFLYNSDLPYIIKVILEFYVRWSPSMRPLASKFGIPRTDKLTLVQADKLLIQYGVRHLVR